MVLDCYLLAHRCRDLDGSHMTPGQVNALQGGLPTWYRTSVVHKSRLPPDGQLHHCKSGHGTPGQVIHVVPVCQEGHVSLCVFETFLCAALADAERTVGRTLGRVLLEWPPVPA